MCEANVYLEKDGKEELLLEAVYFIKPEEGKLLIVNIFGEQLTLKASFKQIDLLHDRIILKED